MKKSRFTDEQIIGFLKTVESGVAVKDLGASTDSATRALSQWRGKFGGKEVSEARRLRELEGENAKLKKLLAEAMVDIKALKVVARGKR